MKLYVEERGAICILEDLPIGIDGTRDLPHMY